LPTRSRGEGGEGKRGAAKTRRRRRGGAMMRRDGAIVFSPGSPPPASSLAVPGGGPPGADPHPAKCVGSSSSSSSRGCRRSPPPLSSLGLGWGSRTIAAPSPPSAAAARTRQPAREAGRRRRRGSTSAARNSPPGRAGIARGEDGSELDERMGKIRQKERWPPASSGPSCRWKRRPGLGSSGPWVRGDCLAKSLPPRPGGGRRRGLSRLQEGRSPREEAKLFPLVLYPTRLCHPICRTIQSPWIMYTYAYRPSSTLSSANSREDQPTNRLPLSSPLPAPAAAQPFGSGLPPRLLLFSRPLSLSPGNFLDERKGSGGRRSRTRGSPHRQSPPSFSCALAFFRRCGGAQARGSKGPAAGGSAEVFTAGSG
jgi:hypothetical protein